MQNINKLSTMNVTKRDGSLQEIQLDKIRDRIYNLCKNLKLNDQEKIAVCQKVIQGLIPNIKTSELDILAVETAATLSTINSDYRILAARIAISNLHKNTESDFAKNIETFYNYIHPKTGEPFPLISKEIYNIIQKN